MSKNRYINTGFWSDEYIENLEPLDKYLFLYCLTSPLANIAGIYKISLSKISFETGLEKNRLLKAFEGFKKDEKIFYSTEGWLACKNSIKHQKLNKNIKIGINEIINNSPRFIVDWVCKDYLIEKNERLSIDFESLLKASNYLNINLNLNSNINLNSKEEKILSSKKIKQEKNKNEIKIIIDYLNQKCKTKFTYKNKSFNSHINARLSDKFTIDDFKKVIDNKIKDKNFQDNPGWYNPDTLFSPSHFEKYLNEYHKKTDAEIQAEREAEDQRLEANLMAAFKKEKEDNSIF